MKRLDMHETTLGLTAGEIAWLKANRHTNRLALFLIQLYETVRTHPSKKNVAQFNQTLATWRKRRTTKIREPGELGITRRVSGEVLRANVLYWRFVDTRRFDGYTPISGSTRAVSGKKPSGSESSISRHDATA